MMNEICTECGGQGGDTENGPFCPNCGGSGEVSSIDELTQKIYDVLNQHDAKICFNPCPSVIKLKAIIAEAYKKGRIDGSIEVINGTCEICHAYPMTANCNNAGCDV